MPVVQTHAAPDLLSLTTRAIERPGVSGIITHHVPVAQIGTVVVDAIAMSGQMVALAQSDLRSLCKEAYRLGWAAKCIHQRDLIAKLTQEIGT